MSLFSNIKGTIQNKQLYGKNRAIFDSLVADIEYYAKEIKPEEKSLGNHEHFMKKEIQDKILKEIQENNNVLYIKGGKLKQTLAMMAAEVGFERVVLEALDNENASLLTDTEGKNLGMYAAYHKLEKATLKALDNKQASLQKCKYWGKNIGMYAADSKMETVVLKALENNEASTQQDADGFNLGMHCANFQLEKATLKALDNPIASVQQNKGGYNIGMFAAKYGLEQATLKALDNYTASYQKTKYGSNIGILAAAKELSYAAAKAVELYPDIALDDDHWNHSIRLYVNQSLIRKVNVDVNRETAYALEELYFEDQYQRAKEQYDESFMKIVKAEKKQFNTQSDLDIYETELGD